jgi:hypothetical protein
MQITVLARVNTSDQVGLLPCPGAQSGDRVLQAMAWSNGDDVSGVFGPIIPANNVIAQVKPVGSLECLLQLLRTIPDA